MKYNPTQLTAMRLKARYLIVVKGIMQKEVAGKIGVSEKTISSWNKKYNWKNQASKAIKRKGGIEAIMDGFFEYVENNTNMQMSQQTKALWAKYLQRLEAG